MATIKAGWGYHEEVCGNLKGAFRRAQADVEGVTVAELHYAGYHDDVLVQIGRAHV